MLARFKHPRGRFHRSHLGPLRCEDWRIARSISSGRMLALAGTRARSVMVTFNIWPQYRQNREPRCAVSSDALVTAYFLKQSRRLLSRSRAALYACKRLRVYSICLRTRNQNRRLASFGGDDESFASTDENRVPVARNWPTGSQSRTRLRHDRFPTYYGTCCT